MARRSTLRASDAEREQIAERLRQAAIDGRLVAEELDERLGRVFSARTYGELDATVADLPGRQTGRPRRQARDLVTMRSPIMIAVAAVAVALVLALAALVLAGLVTGWVLWLVFGRPVLGRGRRSRHVPRGHGHRRPLRAGSGWDRREAASQQSRGSWT